MGTPLIQINNLKKYFGDIKAVDDVTFHIDKGETLGLVGESGCGKSTIGKTIMKLYEPTDGNITFDGNDRRDMQMIFQDPFSSLNPYMTIEDIINEPLQAYNVDKNIRSEIISDLLKKVGLNKEDKNRYPGEFSGGQRQRVAIARALSVKPKLIICDEPTSALDVSVQAQVMNMLSDLQRDFGLTYLFISHNLAMIKHISHRIGIMYLGKIVELGPTDLLYNNPLHPYTKALLSSIPIADLRISRLKKREILTGDIPSPMNPPKGCRFHTRCKYKMEVCEEVDPAFREMAKNHVVACHLY